MKRTTTKALMLALFASLAFTGAVSAKSHDGAAGGAKHGTSVAHAGTTAASLKTKGNASHPGGVFRVLAIVHAAKDFRPATVDAIVHFASGDVSAVLTRSGNGSAYHAAVPVPAAEPAGVVLIDATAIVNGATLTATGQGKIVVEDTTQLTPPAPLVVPSPPTCTPDASETPDPSETADPSESPDPSESTNPSDVKDQSQSADPSESPEPSESAEPSESPDPSNGAGLTTQTTDPCASQPAAVTTTFTLSPELMAKVIAFVESLLA
jgi:hypothetical protein